MAVRALPVDHAVLHEKNDTSIRCSEGYKGRTPELFQHKRSNRKKRNKQESKC
jgi:hypothetical protein